MEHRAYAANPIGANAHINVPLSNLAVEAFARPDADGFLVADQLFPAISVGKQSDLYYEIVKDEFLRVLSDNGALRAPKTEARRVEFSVSSNAYYAHNYALAAENALEDLANADRAIMLRQNSTKLVTGLLKMHQEIRIANIVTSISNVGSGVSLTGTAKWSNAASDPIGDVNTGHAFMRSQTGMIPNVAVIDWDTMQVVRRHPALLDMYKYTSGGELNDSQLREVFKVSRILVPRGVKNVAKEGLTASMNNIWGNVCVLAYVGQATGMQTMTLGLRFQWRNDIYPADFAVLTDVQNRAGQKKIEVLEVGHYQDEKVVAKELGYTITGTI